MLESIDEKLQHGTDWVKVAFENIEYWHAILFVILNGGLISMATTGYLEDKSIDPVSLPGVLYFINFLMMLIILTVKISPTTRFLSKIITMAVLGYAIFWQFGATVTEVKGFTPLAVHPFMSFLFYGLVVGAALWAFNGNDKLSQAGAVDLAEFEDMKRRLEAYENQTVEE
jgi:hypothetical protein